MDDIKTSCLRGKLLIIVSLSGLSLFLGCLFLNQDVKCVPLPMNNKPKHHTTTGFCNYPVVTDDPSVTLSFVLRRFWGSLFLPEVPQGHYVSEEAAIHQLNALKTKNSLTWVGHSTFLTIIDGKTVLIDPFFSEYASPFIRGPKRYVSPGISIKKFPPIDIIIVSHNHYDHLDEKAVESLLDKEKIHVFVPLGLKTFFTQRGYVNVQELDWEESTLFDGIRITALPAIHFSGRRISDRNKTLWCSWAIQSSSGKYYYSGDTGYSSEVFQEIGEKYGPFDLAIVSIGAYEPQKIMKEFHTTPEEAIKLGLDIKAQVMVGAHWGTIELSSESHWEPPQRFKKEAQKKGIPEGRTWVMKIGETRVMPP